MTLTSPGLRYITEHVPWEQCDGAEVRLRILYDIPECHEFRGYLIIVVAGVRAYPRTVLSYDCHLHLCQFCDRALRLFVHDLVTCNLDNAETCRVCSWEKDNLDATKLLVFRSCSAAWQRHVICPNNGLLAR